MKNLKLTLATTLSVMALTFTGTAFADREYNNYKRSVDKNSVKSHHKNVNKNRRTPVTKEPSRK